MKLNEKLAVFDGSRFVNGKMEKTEPVTEPITDLGVLARLALDLNFVHVWVLPGTEFSRRITRGFIEQAGEEWDVFASYPRPFPERVSYARIWRKKTSGWAGRTIKIGFPESELGVWNWQCPNPAALLATVTYLENVLGLPVEWSSGHMGIELIKALNVEKRASWIAPVSLDLFNLPTSTGKPLPMMRTARDLIWHRPLSKQEIRRKRIHKIDKNSTYLAAATGAWLGEGDPEYSADGGAYNPKFPGIWRVVAEQAESLYDGIALPNPARTEWMTVPAIECCKKLGYQVQVLEGYHWSQEGKYHRTLESWAKTLWDVRLSLKEGSARFNPDYKHPGGRANAYHTIQDIAHITVGKLADDDAPGPLLRPDFWAILVGRAFSNIFYNVESLRLRGIVPALIKTDAFWIVSDEEDPRLAVPEGMIDPDKLGGYKSVYSLPMTKEIVNAFATEKSPGRLVRLLNAMAGKDFEEIGE